MERLITLYQAWRGEAPQRVETISAAGSNRSYYRLFSTDDEAVIGVIGTSVEENEAFIYLANHFTAQQLAVPEVLAVSADCYCYLQTDLGSASLFDALATGRAAQGDYSPAEQALLRATIAALPKLQFEGAKGLDFSYCYPQPEFDRTNVRFDLNYFKYCFLKSTGLDFHEMRLEEAFEELAAELTTECTETFMYRDFQARNVMLTPEGTPCFIDFQGGRKGPIYYDVASFLWQASAHYSADLREQLIDLYLENLSPYYTIARETFRERLQRFVLFRTLQVLGAYGFRGYFERKPHFIKSIPSAIANLRQLLAESACPEGYLKSVLSDLVALPQFNQSQEKAVAAAKEEGLIVRIFSFSYKKGIPEDTSGNGGGYVFDCRYVHNPGRYEPYKKQTGLDQPVIDFLEEDGEILEFLESIYQLADRHTARYIERKFTDLMFSFGCTGGQHRSVYSAQHLAEHIHQKFGVRVELYHREQDIRQTFEATK